VSLNTDEILNFVSIPLVIISSIALPPTCSKREKEALVWVFLEQGLDPLPHPLIPLVDEFPSKVAVYFLGGHLLAVWQCHIIEVGDLEGARVMVQSSHQGGKEKRERRFLSLFFLLTSFIQFPQSQRNSKNTLKCVSELTKVNWIVGRKNSKHKREKDMARIMEQKK